LRSHEQVRKQGAVRPEIVVQSQSNYVGVALHKRGPTQRDNRVLLACAFWARGSSAECAQLWLHFKRFDACTKRKPILEKSLFAKETNSNALLEQFTMRTVQTSVVTHNGTSTTFSNEGH